MHSTFASLSGLYFGNLGAKMGVIFGEGAFELECWTAIVVSGIIFHRDA